MSIWSKVKQALYPSYEPTLAEMSTIHERETGVDVSISGDVKRDNVDQMIDKCATGTQSCCGPEFFEKVSSIKASGEDGNVTIHVDGDVNKKMIEENLSICDCYEK